MKLTKGKISKLYSKNKQSVRRKKYGKGKTGRNRTFRKTKGLNLANKSLKSYYNRRGGAPVNMQAEMAQQQLREQELVQQQQAVQQAQQQAQQQAEQQAAQPAGIKLLQPRAQNSGPPYR